MKVLVSKKPQHPSAAGGGTGTRRRTWMILLSLATAILAISAWHYITLYRDLAAARDELIAAQESLKGVGFEANANDLAAAGRRLDKAEGKIDSAHQHFRLDPLLKIASVVPRVGDQVDAAGNLIDIAGTLVDLGQVATQAGLAAVEVRDNRQPGGPPLTQSLVELLGDTSDEAVQIRDLADRAARQRVQLGNKPLWRPLDNARNRIDEELPSLVDGADQLAQANDVLPAFMGFDGDRRYLVIALNNGELLPGGGLVTAAGVVPVSNGTNGAIGFTDSNGWLPAAKALGVPYIQPPGPLQRYLLRDYSWNLLVSNWDPDYPTWAQQALEFYEITAGRQDVDGIIAVDLVVLEQLLTVTGPKTMDVPGRGPFTFTAANAVLELERMTRPAYVPVAEGDDRKSIIGDLAELIIADMQQLPSGKWGDAVRVVRSLADQRHIQMLSFDPAEQALIRDAGWDGRLLEHTGDYLHFNEASVLSTKLNLIIHPEGSLTIDVTELGDVTHELRLDYSNPLTEWSRDKDADLVKKLMLGGLYGGYLRVFGPLGMTGESVEIDGKPGIIEDTGHEETAEWFGTLLPVEPDATKEVTFRWRSTPPGNPRQVYTLLMQKQAGTIGMCLDLIVRRDGNAPASIHIEGGDIDPKGRVCVTSDVEITATFSD
ncbi:MAG: DUF4012 domain-containing protein [Dehalococcoidia bacterium]